MRKTFFLLFAIYFVTTGHFVMAMSSINYEIMWDNFNEGGGEGSTSTNYSLSDTLGDQGTGFSTSTNFQLSAGYRIAEDEALSFVVRGQTSASEVTYSAFDNALNTATLSSAAGFSTGDYIAVIENSGFSQFVAVGRITDVDGAVVTVDDFDGDGGGMSAVPAGGNDYVYRLASSAASFGTVEAGTEYVSVAMTSVGSSIATGYTVYIQANQEFQNSLAQIMAEVSDGAVTSGVEEYGAEVVGATAFGAGTDLGVSTTQRVIQTSGSSSGVVPDKVGMTYKLSITAATNPGTYTQNVYYTLTPNY